jgi:hypothetical protein
VGWDWGFLGLGTLPSGETSRDGPLSVAMILLVKLLRWEPVTAACSYCLPAHWYGNLVARRGEVGKEVSLRWQGGYVDLS